MGNDDIKRVCKNIKVITYPELAKYKTIDEALAPYGAIVLLYMTEATYGHWVLVMKQPNNTIEVFDSYSEKPDHEFKYIDEKKRKNFNYKGIPYLSKLLSKSKYNIEFNHKQVQKDGDNITTCGMHVCARYLLKGLNLNEYLYVLSLFRDPDELVTSLIKF